MPRHLTKEDRKTIEYCLRLSWKNKEIAMRIKRDESVISREISRNGGRLNYSHGKATQYYIERRIRAKKSQKKIIPGSKISEYIEINLKQLLSPEQIKGRLRRDKCIVLSHETIYKWIYTERKDLQKYLRCQKGQWRRKRGTKKREKFRRLQQFRCIDTRPKSVEKRERIGDWEGDTVIGKNRKNRILTYVDRKSGYARAAVLHTVSAEIVQEKTKNIFKNIPKKKKKTITFDRGTEFGGNDKEIEKKTNTVVYRAHAYHSWERGTNENWNGLLRQFFPKGSDFGSLSQRKLSRVVNILNNRPRKRLNYLSPHEVFVLGLNPEIASHARM